MHAHLNGIDLAYDIAGDGEPVVLIGGTGTPVAGWQFSQAPALLTAGYQVITFASRGVAPSAAPAPPYRVGDMASDTALLIEHLAIEPCHLIGVSLGGFVAEELARSRPDLVRTCVLMASAGTPTAYARAKSEVARELFATCEVPDSYDAVDTLGLILPFDVLQNDDATVEGWRAILAQQSAVWTHPDGRRGQLEAEWSWLLDDDRAAGWAAISAPCLVIAFEHDLYFPPRAGRQAAEAMPHGSFVEIPNATHSGNFEHSDKINPLLLEFLANGVVA